MSIDQLDIQNFRNIDLIRFTPNKNLNFIIGDNGSGKTSLLEAIYYLGSARSFRTPHTKHLIKHGESKFNLVGKISNRATVSRVGISRDSKEIKIKIANTIANSASQLAELLPVQNINPDVHKLMEDGPRYRRRFIEWGVFHVKPNYHMQWQQCRQILKQRNAALKKGVADKELQYWNNALVNTAEIVTKIRDDYFLQLQPHINKYMGVVEDLPKITLKLMRGWSEEKTLLQVLEESLESDRSRGFTQFGPHRADLSIRANNFKAKDVVSRGQQKLIAGILKLAQVSLLIDQKPDIEPVLLVDDLPAELDKTFRSNFLSMVDGLGVQTFITSTSMTLVEQDNLNTNTNVFHVEHGLVSET